MACTKCKTEISLLIMTKILTAHHSLHCLEPTADLHLKYPMYRGINNSGHFDTRTKSLLKIHKINYGF